MATFRLLQARERTEVVRLEELEAFAERLGVSESEIDTYDVLHGSNELSEVIEGVDAVLVGGSGRFSIYDNTPWMSSFVHLLGRLAEEDFPTFASCFGFQGLIVASGGRVERSEASQEVGTVELQLTEQAQSDPLFSTLPGSFSAQAGHKDAALQLPKGAVHLASSSRCSLQAMRIGSHVYATQFHPELTLATNKQRFARYFREYAAVFEGGEAEEIVQSFRPSPVASSLLKRWNALR